VIEIRCVSKRPFDRKGERMPVFRLRFLAASVLVASAALARSPPTPSREAAATPTPADLATAGVALVVGDLRDPIELLRPEAARTGFGERSGA